MVLQHLHCPRFPDETSSPTDGFKLQDASLYVGEGTGFLTGELQLRDWMSTHVARQRRVVAAPVNRWPNAWKSVGIWWQNHPKFLVKLKYSRIDVCCEWLIVL